MTAASDPGAQKEGNKHMTFTPDKTVTQREHTEKIISTYSMYTNANSTFPQYTIHIIGQSVSFMVDSGATNSVIRNAAFAKSPKMSDRFVFSISASGPIVKERFTVPLQCTDEKGEAFQHAFLLSKLCPVNLLGRDLMCRLGLCLISTSDGLQVTTKEQLDCNFLSMGMHSQHPIPQCKFQWKLPPTPNPNLLTLPTHRVCPVNTDFVSSNDLHCFYSCPEPESDDYMWFSYTTDTLHTQHFYWDTHFSALSVDLPQSLQSLLTAPNSDRPYIPLSKPTQVTWDDVQIFVTQCDAATDWTPSDNHTTFYSKSLNAWRTTCQLTMQAERTCSHPAEERDAASGLVTSFLSREEVHLHPHLREVQMTFGLKEPLTWALSKIANLSLLHQNLTTGHIKSNTHYAQRRSKVLHLS